ncbi:unnamed protein product [Cuscuta europaea]|uniref:DUF4283 domain-containing protein n=1 Tax=Cuscuta europaea TaxID=41803 RepID=A0A9P1EMF6_CUSEU|nr:unnamed protein product [Cuscuta europaea]
MEQTASVNASTGPSSTVEQTTAMEQTASAVTNASAVKQAASAAELPADIDLPSHETVTEAGFNDMMTGLNLKTAKDAGPKVVTEKLTGNANVAAIKEGGATALAVKSVQLLRILCFAQQQSVQGNGFDTNKKPWTTLFKDNRATSHGIKLNFVPPKGNSLDFSGRLLPSMVEMWGYCLVGYFTGHFPGLKAIHELKFKWGVKCQVRTHDKGWVIFKFQTEGDRLKVLNGGPFTIFGKLLMLKILSEDFTFDDEEFLKVPIWVKFPHLPMKLWNKDAMSEVASMVGMPLTTDLVTQERSNHNFARVLIEVDASKPPMLSFPIRLPSRKVIQQAVVYETFPNFCFHCKKYGHDPFICKELHEKEELEKNLVEKELKKTNDISVDDTKDAAPMEADTEGLELGGLVEPMDTVVRAEEDTRDVLAEVPEAEIAASDAIIVPSPISGGGGGEHPNMLPVSEEENPLSWLRILPSRSAGADEKVEHLYAWG